MSFSEGWSSEGWRVFNCYVVLTRGQNNAQVNADSVITVNGGLYYSQNDKYYELLKPAITASGGAI